MSSSKIEFHIFPTTELPHDLDGDSCWCYPETRDEGIFLNVFHRPLSGIDKCGKFITGYVSFNQPGGTCPLVERK